MNTAVHAHVWNKFASDFTLTRLSQHVDNIACCCSAWDVLQRTKDYSAVDLHPNWGAEKRTIVKIATSYVVN